MLKHLYIKNYALIEELDIDLHAGFSVITGETGAGKSILLGAIGLLLGQRADTKAIKQGESKCIIEATFDLTGQHLQALFEQEDMEYDPAECIVRRELTAAGKSRAFVNDTPASVSQLKALGEHLVDIHSQHKNLFLGREDFQLNVLDILADNRSLVDPYKTLYRDYIAKRRALKQMMEEAEKNQKDQDYLQYQYDQLREADLQSGEDAELEREEQLLSHAEDIKGSLYRADGMLQGENTCLDMLRQVQHAMESISEVYQPATALAERLESTYIELKDIAAEISSGAEDIEFDPARQTFITERLNTIYTLQQKHHVDSCDALIDLRNQYEAQLDLIVNSDEHIAEAEAEVERLREQVMDQAQAITQSRIESAKRLEQTMCSKLQMLGMPNVNFVAQVTTRTEPDQSGIDKVDFLFSANKNGTPQSIATIASGGEIARVMLSLKAIIAQATHLPTIIFDEIDTGVSGQIADRMAEIMREMCQEGHTQVISITHLPQIAASGAAHYRVYKEDTDDATLSHIIQLTHEERIRELANMLSGSQITEAALENARILLQK